MFKWLWTFSLLITIMYFFVLSITALFSKERISWLEETRLYLMLAVPVFHMLISLASNSDGSFLSIAISTGLRVGCGTRAPNLLFLFKLTLVLGGLLTGIFLIHYTHFLVLFEEYLQ